MKLIRSYSFKCASSLTRQLKESNEKRRIYYYSFQIILGGFIKFAVLIAIALLTGSFTETFAVLAFYAGFRTVGGGYHMDDYTNCMLISLAMFIGLGLIVKCSYSNWSIIALWLLSLLTFVIAMFTAIKYAPADTSFKPMNNAKRNKFLKKCAIIYVLVWQTLNIILIISGYKLLVLAGCFGLLMEAFSISPAGYSLFDYLSCKMKKFRKHKCVSQ